jgi:hypothetical protein
MNTNACEHYVPCDPITALVNDTLATGLTEAVVVEHAVVAGMALREYAPEWAGRRLAAELLHGE